MIETERLEEVASDDRARMRRFGAAFRGSLCFDTISPRGWSLIQLSAQRASVLVLPEQVGCSTKR